MFSKSQAWSPHSDAHELSPADGGCSLLPASTDTSHKVVSTQTASLRAASCTFMSMEKNYRFIHMALSKIFHLTLFNSNIKKIEETS